MSTKQEQLSNTEYQIFACLLLKPELFKEMQLDEKYFKNKKILLYLKNLYEQLLCTTKE